MIEICIPTYKNRKNNLTTRLSSFSKDRKINIFSYEDDDSYGDKSNHIIVPKEYHTVQKMRQFIQNYMGDKTYWVIDDDVVVEEKDLQSTEPFIKVNAIVGLSFIYFLPVQCVLYNGKLLNENNIKFSGDTTVHEDVEILYKASKAGLNIAVNDDAHYHTLELPTTMVLSKEEFAENTLKKFPDFKKELGMEN